MGDGARRGRLGTRCDPIRAAIAVADMAARLEAAGGLLIEAQRDSPFPRSLGAGPRVRAR